MYTALNIFSSTDKFRNERNRTATIPVPFQSFPHFITACVHSSTSLFRIVLSLGLICFIPFQYWSFPSARLCIYLSKPWIFRLVLMKSNNHFYEVPWIFILRYHSCTMSRQETTSPYVFHPSLIPIPSHQEFGALWKLYMCIQGFQNCSIRFVPILNFTFSDVELRKSCLAVSSIHLNGCWQPIFTRRANNRQWKQFTLLKALNAHKSQRLLGHL